MLYTLFPKIKSSISSPLETLGPRAAWLWIGLFHALPPVAALSPLQTTVTVVGRERSQQALLHSLSRGWWRLSMAGGSGGRRWRDSGVPPGVLEASGC